MSNGILITFEGGEGGGKSTQIVRLQDYLRQQGKDVVILREPGGTVISEQIREVVLSNKNIGMAFTTEVLLFQAARAQIYREIVLPSLAASKVILMDRSRDSSVVYQGLVRGFGKDMIEELNQLSTKETYPDLTFLLDLPVETGLKRREATGKMDRIDMESKEFHEKIRQAYLDLAKTNDHGRWLVIDATQDIESIQSQIQAAVIKKIS